MLDCFLTAMELNKIPTKEDAKKLEKLKRSEVKMEKEMYDSMINIP